MSKGETPLVSIICVAYNVEKYIASTLESLVGQVTDFSYEILVGENCSTDSTREIVIDYAKRYPEKIKPFLHKENIGLYRNCLTLWKAARGKYIAWCFGDDLWTYHRKLQKQIDILEKNPNLVACFHKTDIIFDDGRYFGPLPSFDEPHMFSFPELCERNIITIPSVVYRNVIRSLPEELPMVEVCDYFIHLMYSLKGDFAYLPEPMAIARIRPFSYWESRPIEVRSVITLESILNFVKFTNYNYKEYFVTAFKICSLSANISYDLLDELRGSIDFDSYMASKLLLRYSGLGNKSSNGSNSDGSERILHRIMTTNFETVVEEKLNILIENFLSGVTGTAALIKFTSTHLAKKSLIEKFRNMDLVEIDLSDSDSRGSILPVQLSQRGELGSKNNSLNSCILLNPILDQDNVKETFKDILSLLKPWGKLMVVIQIAELLKHPIRGGLIPTPGALRMVLQDSGFRNVEIFSLGGADYSLAQWLAKWIENRHMADEIRSKYRGMLSSFLESLLITDSMELDKRLDSTSQDMTCITNYYAICEKVDQEYLKIINELNDVEPAVAIREIEKYAEQRGYYAIQHAHLSQLFKKTNNLRKAIKHGILAVEIEPGNVAYKLNLAECYYKAKLYDQAYTLYKELLKHKPKDVEILRILAELAKMLNNQAEWQDYHYKVLQYTAKDEFANLD